MDIVQDVDLVRNVAKSILLVSTVICLAGIPHIHRSLVAWKLRRRQRVAVAESLLVVGYIDMLQFFRRIGARKLPTMAIIYMFIQLFSMVQTYILLAAIHSQSILIHQHVDTQGAKVVADGYTTSNYSSKDDLFKSARKVDDTFLDWDKDVIPKDISFSPFFVVKKQDANLAKLQQCIDVDDYFQVNNVRLMDINFGLMIEKLTPKLSSYWGSIPTPPPTTSKSTVPRTTTVKTTATILPTMTTTTNMDMQSTDLPMFAAPTTVTFQLGQPMDPKNAVTDDATATFMAQNTAESFPFDTTSTWEPPTSTESLAATPTEATTQFFKNNGSNNACERSNSTVSNMIYIRTFSDYLTEMGLFSVKSSFLPPSKKDENDKNQVAENAAMLWNPGCDTLGNYRVDYKVSICRLIDREFFSVFNQSYGSKEDYSYLLSSAGQLYQSLMYPDSPPDVIYPSSQAIQFLFSTLAFDFARSPIPATVTLKMPGTHIQGWLLVVPLVFTLFGLLGFILAFVNIKAQQFPVTALEWAMVACETKSHVLVTSKSSLLNNEVGLQSDNTAVVEMIQHTHSKEFANSKELTITRDNSSLDRHKDFTVNSGRNSLEDRFHTKRRHLKQMVWKTSENDFLELDKQ